MSYDVNAKKQVATPSEQTRPQINTVLETLGGSLTERNQPDRGQFEAHFNKKIKGQPLPNRCELRVKVTPAGSGSVVLVKAYPIDPMGNKLKFGVRGQAAQTVVDTFLAELSHTLGQ
jgi:hypothetical protein